MPNVYLNIIHQILQEIKSRIYKNQFMLIFSFAQYLRPCALGKSNAICIIGIARESYQKY